MPKLYSENVAPCRTFHGVAVSGPQNTLAGAFGTDVQKRRFDYAATFQKAADDMALSECGTASETSPIKF
jgi:hypothetical protein